MYQVPLRLSIHRTIFIIIQAADSTLFSPSVTATSLPPHLLVGEGEGRVQDPSVTWAAAVGSSDILFPAFFSDQMDAFSIQAFPLLSPAFGDLLPHSFSMFVNFGSMFLSLVCFITPFPLPLPHSPQFGAPLVRTLQTRSRILRIVLHALNSLYDT